MRLLFTSSLGEPRRGRTVEHASQYRQRVRLPIVVDIAQHRYLIRHQQVRLLRGRFQVDAFDTPLRRLDLLFALRQRMCRNRAEKFLGEPEHLFGFHVAAHHQSGVVRRIPRVRTNPGHLRAACSPGRSSSRSPACDKDEPNTPLAIISSESCACGSSSVRMRRSSMMTFISLANSSSENCRFTMRSASSSSASAQLRFVQLLVVGGVIARGERIVAAAGAGDDPGEFTARHFLRALEHHVLEHMRHAGGAADFIHAAGAIPHHRHRHRGAVILLDDNLQAVGQRALRRAAAAPAGTSARPTPTPAPPSACAQVYRACLCMSQEQTE